MATIAEFTIPTDDFALGRIFERSADATVELERVVPTDTAIVPYFWVRDAELDRIRDVLGEVSALESVTLVDDLGDEGLFRARWKPGVESVLTGVVRTNLTLLSAVGTRAKWTFEFRAEETTQISSFKQYCTDRGIDVTLRRLHSLAEMQMGEYDLTENQREALLLAFDEGYYDDSREIDLERLADQLGISRPAFADRLRRGIRNLIGSTIAQQSSSDGDG